MNRCIAMIAFFVSTGVLAAPNGWRWYNEPTQDAKAPAPITKPNTVTRTLSARAQLTWFKEQHQEAQAAATIDPSNNQKVEKAMRLNQYVSNQSSQFGMTFKEVLLSHPELSYTKDRPVEQAARSTYLELEREKKVHTIKQMAAEGWGFFFVYEGKDTLSQTLAPSIQQFATTHGIEVLGISKDGTTLESIRENRMDDNTLNVAYLPALLLVNPNTKTIKPLAYGFISQDQLLGRFYNVATHYNSPDF
ncbi:conjugative transfer protein TraF (plasmid) [Aliivibrio salmonicida LFI1238]|uniref:Conjugative transfer protein TraF n=1 Tax=Aliivibrio salmonicida (strain LFI1238) TaxID=316275 RepID=B6ESY5_ALISL|nr:type-F conjugative transfer system pilin assembly protein TraF [Aliivibrio salmonicida]CAQ81873.1 conjugative transfer protein TraF [Aliivibrio salmonicida LFI1238]